MTLLEALAVALAGAVAGGVNTLVGSGTLVTFPTLVAVGFSPVVANVSNTVGLVPGGVSAMIGYRRELRGQARRCLILGAGTTVGAVIGGVLLLALPEAVFESVVPILILLAVVLMALRPSPSPTGDDPQPDSPRQMGAGVASALGTSVYGGYFGAAQGIILLALLRLSLADDLQRLNGLKNVLVAIANAVAAILFIAVADVQWGAALLVAAGSVVGAQVAARYGRRIPQEALRRIVIVYGTIVAAILLIS